MANREIECQIHSQTIKDLIIAHLHNVGLVRDTEEVVDIFVGPPDTNNISNLTIRIEPDVQLIFHV